YEDMLSQPAPKASGPGTRQRSCAEVLHGFSEWHPFQAVESSQPGKSPPSGAMAFAHWAGRVDAQSEFAAARELAGLPDSSLADLAAEFERTPQRQRTDLMRLGYPIALVALTLAALCGLGYLAAPARGEGLVVFERLTFALLGIAAVAMGLGNFGAFK